MCNNKDEIINFIAAAFPWRPVGFLLRSSGAEAPISTQPSDTWSEISRLLPPVLPRNLARSRIQGGQDIVPLDPRTCLMQQEAGSRKQIRLHLLFRTDVSVHLVGPSEVQSAPKVHRSWKQDVITEQLTGSKQDLMACLCRSNRSDNPKIPEIIFSCDQCGVNLHHLVKILLFCCNRNERVWTFPQSQVSINASQLL